MRANEFIIEDADYVHPNIFLATKAAKAKGGKVIRSAGGYFKVVPRDAPGDEYVIDNDALQRREDLKNQIAELTRAEKGHYDELHALTRRRVPEKEYMIAVKKFRKTRELLTKTKRDLANTVAFKKAENGLSINEAFALTPFLMKWATGQALGWLKKQVAEKGRQTIANTQQLAAVDQSIARALGQQDKEVGSILTAYVIHLIEKGDPIEAAIKTGVGIAREMVMQSDTVQGFKAQAFNTLRQLEPMADQWEALLTRRQQEPAPVQDLAQTQLEPIEPEDPLQPYINNDNQRDY